MIFKLKCSPRSRSCYMLKLWINLKDFSNFTVPVHKSLKVKICSTTHFGGATHNGKPSQDQSLKFFKYIKYIKPFVPTEH